MGWTLSGFNQAVISLAISLGSGIRSQILVSSVNIGHIKLKQRSGAPVKTK